MNESDLKKNKSFGRNNKIKHYFYLICLLASLLPAHARPISDMKSQPGLFVSSIPCEIPPWNGIPWKSMYIYGNPWKSMEIHGTSMDWSIHGIPPNAMEFHGVSMGFHIECHGVPCSIDGVPWNAMNFHGVSLEVHGIPRNIVEFHEMPSWGSLRYRWSSMECHSVSMEFDRIPCSLYEKIHRNSVIKQLINLLTTCSSLHFLLDRKIGNIWKLSKSKIVRLV